MPRTSTQKLVRLDSLQPHPINKEIYRDTERTDQENEALRDSLKANGVWDGHIKVHAQTQTILHGHRRAQLALEIDVQEVVVTMVDHLPADLEDPEVVQFLLNGNAQRVKTNSERLREFEMVKKVEQQLAKRRMITNPSADPGPGPEAHTQKKGTARDIAAKKLGLGCGSKAEKALKALKLADEMEASEPEKATAIKEAINKSITTGAKVAQSLTATEPEVVTVVRARPRSVPKQPASIIDGVQHRSISDARKLPEFADELAFLTDELPKVQKAAESLERRMKKLMRHYVDMTAHDRYWPQWMTAICAGWKEDGALDYAKQLQELNYALIGINSAFKGITDSTQDASIKLDP